MHSLYTASLTHLERQSLAQEAEAIQFDHLASLNEQLQTAVQQSSITLDSMQKSLQALTHTGEIEYVMVKNLPLDRNLPTPPSNGKRPAGKTTFISELTLLQLAKAAGLQPVGYHEEHHGALIHQIAPATGREKALSSAGRVPLGFHTDLAILKPEYRPQYLFLHGLINEGQTPTFITCLDDALRALQIHKPKLVSILREPRFRIESPAILQVWNGKVIKSEPRALVYRSPNGMDEIAANLNAVTATDAEAKDALLKFMEVLPQVTQEILIAPGTALLFNNHRCLHGRPAIQTGRRWLQRLYCRHSLSDLQKATGSDAAEHIFSLSHLVLE